MINIEDNNNVHLLSGGLSYFIIQTMLKILGKMSDPLIISELALVQGLYLSVPGQHNLHCSCESIASKILILPEDA